MNNVEIQFVLDQEIIWCQNHRFSEQKTFENGFIEGVKQAKRLIAQLSRTKKKYGD